MTIKQRKAHVIGGGIGGMAIAASLAQRGWDVVVHERSPELREIGAGIYLKENSVEVLEGLGCLSSVTRQSTRIRRSELRDNRGRVLLSRDVGGERVFTVLREDLHRELAIAASNFGASIRLNSKIERITCEGEVVASDGTKHVADLIVGADGLGSLVRRQAGLEKDAVRMPNGSSRFLVPWTAGDPSEGSIEIWSEHKRVMVVPVGEATTYFCASSREDDERGTALPFDVEYWSRSFPELAHLFERVTPDMGVHHAHGLVRVHGWQRGCVAILGDAVHGQPPNLGQGAGMAIANGHALAELLETQPSINAALISWENRLRKITEQVQAWSKGWDAFVHQWPLPIEGLRSGVIWTLATVPTTRKYWGRLYRGRA